MMKTIIAFLAALFTVGSAGAQTADQATTTSATRVAAVNVVSSPPVTETNATKTEARAAAEQDNSKAQPKAESEEPSRGLKPPNTDKLRVHLSFMGAWMHDPANAALGFEKQGRVGWVIVGLSGKLSEKLRYLMEINPVNENYPLAACGEADYFFPNAAQNIGLNVSCDPNGRMRVDDYRFVALDPVRQQGMIRQAYVELTGGSFRAKFGRFILPMGLSWEETGAFSAKDTPHIARMNTEANFGVDFGWTWGHIARVDAAAIMGDGNRFSDYNYFYLLDGSLDSNSAITGVVSGLVHPIKQVDVRAAYKFGYAGSKVERLPNFYASKRNDQAIVASMRYAPSTLVTVFGEYARYTWGLTKTSAQMLGLDQSAVVKPGYYVGGEARYPVGRFHVGGSIIREELARDDSLVKYMAERGMYLAQLGKKERAVIYRLWIDTPGGVRIGWFINDHSNPFPQLSGIVAVGGPSAYQNDWSGAKTGFTVQFRLQ